MPVASRTQKQVIIPYTPRIEFVPFHNRTQRWAVIVAHRRAGKTVACINDLVKGALQCLKKKPRFAYIAPTYSQAKDIVWDYLKEYALVVPGSVANESELRVDFPNGGRVRLYGSDNYDRLRGLYLDGVVNDEFGDQDPRGWTEVIRPTLSDRQGWGVFIGTPRGKNHFQERWEMSEGNEEWFRLMLKASQTNLVSEEDLADAKKELDYATYQAEYECSFAGSVVGSYYAYLLDEAEDDGRVTDVPWDPDLLVHTVWDIGFGDSTAIWFFQVKNGRVFLIDYHEQNGVGLDKYIELLRSKKYMYGKHVFPCDIQDPEFGSGKTRLATLAELGVYERDIIICGVESRTDRKVPYKIETGINAVRRLLPKCYFDKTLCEDGLNVLRNYRRKFDSKKKVFGKKPDHNWTSHGSDSFRYLAMSIDEVEVSGLSGVATEVAWNTPIDYNKHGTSIGIV